MLTVFCSKYFCWNLFNNYYFQLLPHPDGGVITVAYEGFFYLPKHDGTWTNLNINMKVPRFAHTAFWIPDSGTTCKDTGK